MKKKVIAIVGVVVFLVSILLSACSTVKDEKILVAYFSATGNTKAVAVQLAEDTGADMFEIIPKEPYTEVQLGYDDPDQRITKEQADDNCRVEIAGTVENFEQYDTIYIGYPIWYGKVPRIILTFLESYNFEGKKVIPFCTSDNDGLETGLDEIKNAVPDAEWQEGKRFDGGKVTESLNESGKIADDTVKQEIADFAEKSSPNSETNKKKQSSTMESTTKTVTGKVNSTNNESSSSVTEASESTTVTTTTTATTPATTTTITEKQKTTATTTTTTERVTESTTLGEHDTPYIPIP